ncbi:kinase-like domain-containing protein, partial [Gilbertella persicaria]|uniref:kinase-like domain-containing protein n=1 Tax=Gilbertella persicaria TaxID=101096 RepID=UPI0022206A4B
KSMGAICCKQEEVDFEREVELQHFYLLRVIGKGAFGKVRIVQHKGDLIQYALKYISKSKCIELNATSNILTERRILEKINYPLVVNLRYAFHDDENLFMVLDLMLGGDLRFHLERMGSFNELQTQFYVADLILSIHHIHKLMIIHRDIKPDNVLLDANGHAHLSDFNIATQLTKKKSYKNNRAGSLVYMAPEILEEKRYTTDVDWWSLGVTMFELLFGKRPFNGRTNEELRNSIIHDPLVIPTDIPVSPECIEILEGLLSKSPRDRLGHGVQGFKKLKTHAWFKGLNWDELENKTAVPPFIPNHDKSNFDAVHELEELLFEDAPLKPHKKSTSRVKSDTMKDLIEMDDNFLPYDYTKHVKTVEQQEDKDISPTEDIILPSVSTSLSTAGSLLRRVGEKIDQSKYKSQGYYELSANDTRKFFYHRLCGYMTSGPFTAMILASPNAIQDWRALIGPTHPVRARVNQPNTLRAHYGLTDTRNSFHGSGIYSQVKSMYVCVFLIVIYIRF